MAEAIVIQSQSNAYSAQNISVLSESQDGCWGMCKWNLSWWRENAQWFITEGTQEKMLKLGTFSFSLHLDFLFELNEVCM